MSRFLLRLCAAAGLALGLAACQGGTTVTENLPTKPTTPVSVTPVTPIAVAPRPAPTPTPNPPEDPPGGGGPADERPTSDQPVARLLARVYFVECGGVQVPGSGDASEAPVGCRVHLDVTPKDSQGRPTRAVGTPRWTWSNPAIISASSDEGDYTPTLTALAPGDLSIDCTLDNVQSNTVRIRLK